MDEAQSERWDQLVAQAQACWGHDAPRMLALGTELVGLDPEEAYGYQVLAVGHLCALDLDPAQTAAAKSLALEPESAFAHYLMGLVLDGRSKDVAAERHYMRCLELDPEDPDPHVRIGEICLGQQDYEGARDAARRALTLDAELAEAHLLLGKAVDEDENQARDLAATHFRQAIACDPEEAGAHAALAAWDLRADRLAEAEQGARAALRRDPSDEENRALLARVLRRRHPLYRLLWKPQRVLAHLLRDDNQHLEVVLYILGGLCIPLHVTGLLAWHDALGGLVALVVGYLVVLGPADAIFKHVTRARVLREAGEIEPLTPQAKRWRLVAWLVGAALLWGGYGWLVLHPAGRRHLPQVAICLGVALALLIAAGMLLGLRDAVRRRRRNAVLQRLEERVGQGGRQEQAE